MIAAINHLIIAAASARQDDLASARPYAQKARASWPIDLQEKGVLWFDTAEELHHLQGLVGTAASDDGDKSGPSTRHSDARGR